MATIKIIACDKTNSMENTMAVKATAHKNNH